ncbi:hypothetical protein CDD82_6218 [Ophiocordyceps australis]|uniref:Uncharacterized protein n=1 Tax=Ophiocordyceps australis TaxID=1399860 RepID=A0A2C5YYM8_9HYPO|nr:hypothetical protein CDD82_6218 [Ophiocordyceps australis]
MEDPSPMLLGREYSLACLFEPTIYRMAMLVRYHPSPPFAFQHNERNRRIRAAFNSTGPYVDRAVKKRLESPYVPGPRKYPNAGVMREYEQHRRKIARALLGLTLLRRPGVRKPPEWGTLLALLLKITPRVDQTQRMAVVKVVMPKDENIETGRRFVKFFDSRMEKFVTLRVAVPVNHNSTSIVLRGKRDLVSNAVNDLAAKHKDIKIYQLGDIGSISYEVMHLWPKIEGMSVEVRGKKTQYPDQNALEKTVWMHREPPAQWIDVPYEEIPRPRVWTKESLEKYTATIANSRIRPDLVMKFYRKPGAHGKLINTESMRIRLLLATMSTASGRRCATASVIERIMALAARHLGYITKARKLLIRAENSNVPLGTDAFNILLQGYLVRHDISFFHTMVFFMGELEIPPNTYTWLLFLKLVQRRIIREKVIAAMQNLGMLEDIAARRGVASVMAGQEAHLAFHKGATLGNFVEEYSKRWIKDEWLPPGALNAVLTEHLRFHHRQDGHIHEYQEFLKDHPVDMSTINVVLRHAAAAKDWVSGLWAVDMLHKHGHRPNQQTYTYLLALAHELHLPATLGVIFFYAVLERKLRHVARKVVDRVFLAPGGRRSPVGWTDSLNLEQDFEIDQEDLFGTEIYFPFCDEIDESCLASDTMDMREEADEEDESYEALDDAGYSVVSQQDDLKAKMKPTRLFWRHNPAPILSHSMSRLLEENPMMPNTSPSAGAEWAILTTCPGYEPLEPLANMVRTAFYNIDEPRSHRHHNRDASAASASLASDKLADNTEIQDGTMQALDVPLVDVHGQRPSQVVRLNNYMNPRRMYRPRNWRSLMKTDSHPDTDTTCCKKEMGDE